MSNPQSNGVNLSEYPLIQNSVPQSSFNQNPEVFEEEEELNFSKIARIIHRRGWLMLGVGLAVTFFVGSRLMSRPPIYQERFQLLVQPPGADTSNPLQGIQGLSASLSMGQEVSYYDTQIQILLSNKLLFPIVDQVNQEFLNDPVNREYFQGDDPRKFFDLEFLLRNLKVIQSKKTQILEVSFQDKDPKLVEFVLRALSNAYLAYTLEDQNIKSAQQLSFVDKQIPAIKNRLASLQKQLQEFRLKTNFIDPQSQGTVISNSLFALNQAKQQNDAQLNQSIALYNNLRKQLGIGEQQAIALSALTESPRYMGLLEQLRQIDSKLAAASARYTNDNIIIQQLQTERANLLPILSQEAKIALKGISVDSAQFQTNFVSPNSIRLNLTQQILVAANQVRQAQAVQKSLAVTEQQMRQYIQDFANGSGRYAELTGEIEIATKSLTSVLSAKQALEVESAKQFIPWRLVSEIRTPRKPYSQALRNVLLSLLAGVVAGVAIGLLAESLDRSFHTPEEVTEETGISVLGTIPFQPGMTDFKVKAFKIFDQKKSDWTGFMEAFSFLYTNLFFLRERRSCRSFVITSAIPGEGKSTNAFFLAQAAARIGQKVLLVDGDRYFPQQQRWSLLAQVHGKEPEVVFEELPDDSNNQIIPSLMSENLYVIKAAGKWFNPTELVSSKSLAMFIKQWEEEFDLILVDSPPLLGISDTKLLANQTDGVLLVVRLDKTSRDLTKEVLLELKMSNIPIWGIIANGAKNSDRRDYYYYNYYRKAKAANNQLTSF